MVRQKLRQLDPAQVKRMLLQHVSRRRLKARCPDALSPTSPTLSFCRYDRVKTSSAPLVTSFANGSRCPPFPPRAHPSLLPLHTVACACACAARSLVPPSLPWLGEPSGSRAAATGGPLNEALTRVGELDAQSRARRSSEFWARNGRCGTVTSIRTAAAR
eukprot:scaffold137175_cov30-Tisochrysis_lutea.AAC.6